MDLDQAAAGNEKDNQTASDELERAFCSGVFGNADSKQLIEIGNELNKVRMYANQCKVDDVPSQTVVDLALSAYFAGVSPLIRIESSLLIAKSLENECAFALSVRAYIEVAGRIHKGVRLWRNHQMGCCNMDQLSKNIGRLLARFHPKNAERKGRFKGDGYNVWWSNRSKTRYPISRIRTMTCQAMFTADLKSRCSLESKLGCLT